MKTVEEVKAQYPWEDGMCELSGFGGEYEDACRRMFYAGLTWLENYPNSDLRAREYENVFGIFIPGSEDAQKLEDTMMAEEPECSGNMMHQAMNHLFFVAKQGWEKYVEASKKNR